MEKIESCQFQCVYTHDLAVQKEFSKGAVYAKPLHRFLNIAVIALLSPFYPLMVFVLDSAEEYCRSILTITSFYLVIGGLRMISHRGGGIAYKRILYTNGGNPPRCDIRFLDDKILQISEFGDIQNTFRYEQIKSILETQNLFLLGMDYQLYLIVDKRNLTAGDFSDFLLCRCTGVKKQKVVNVRLSQRLTKIKYFVILLSTLLAVLHLPSVQIKERLCGQLHNGMSYTSIANELEVFGVTGLSEGYLADLDALNLPVFLTGENKLKSLLCTIGLGNYNTDTQSWDPPTGGVLLLSYSSYAADGMYIELLNNLSSMTGSELAITNIQETRSENEGYVRVDFLLNGSPHSADLVYYGELIDREILNILNQLLSDSGKQLYFTDNDGYSCFVFYGNCAWAEAFSNRTGLSLTTDIYKII